MTFAHAFTVSVTRPAPLGPTGSPTGDPAEPHTIDGCAVGPRASEDLDGRARTGVDADVSLYAPYGADLRPGDRVAVPSGPYAGTWRVEGDAAHWLNPFTGREAGTVADLVKVTG